MDLYLFGLEAAKEKKKTVSLDETLKTSLAVLAPFGMSKTHIQQKTNAGTQGDNRQRGQHDCNKDRLTAVLPLLLLFLPHSVPPPQCAGRARQMGFYDEWIHGMNL